MFIIRSRRTLALAFVTLFCVIYLIDSQTEVAVLDDTSLPVGMEKPKPKMSYEVFVKQAAAIDPLYPIGIGMASLPNVKDKIPRYLKYREDMLTPVVNQSECASCWAISVCHMIADRISLITGGKIKRPLSHQELVSCFDVRGDLGCTQGGSPEKCYRYIAENGIALASDYPYVQTDTTKVAPCDAVKLRGKRTYIQRGSFKSLCEDPYKYEEGSAKYKEVVKQNMENMRTELYLNGPIVITILCYANLYNFSGLQIYTHTEGEYIGGHAALCVGFADEVNGKEEGFDGKYYVIKNSWSSHWPLKSPSSKGYLYIRAGENVAGIESRASTCQICITDEIRSNMVGSLDESRYVSYSDYVNDPQRQMYITKATRLRAMFK